MVLSRLHFGFKHFLHRDFLFSRPDESFKQTHTASPQSSWLILLRSFIYSHWRASFWRKWIQGYAQHPPQSAPINWACPPEPTQTINTQVTVPNTDMIVPPFLQTKPAGYDSPCHRWNIHALGKSLVPSLVFDLSDRSKDTDCLCVFGRQLVFSF